MYVTCLNQGCLENNSDDLSASTLEAAIEAVTERRKALVRQECRDGLGNDLPSGSTGRLELLHLKRSVLELQNRLENEEPSA